MDNFKEFSKNPSFGRVVRITIPAKAAFDLGSMQKITASVLDRLGCPACHSGMDLRWDFQDRFQVGPDLQVRELFGTTVG